MFGGKKLWDRDSCQKVEGRTRRRDVQAGARRRPFRRWLLAEGHGVFPTQEQQVLDYLDVLWEGGAARSAYKSLQADLGFLEESGERPEPERLAGAPSVKNAVLQHTARRATRSRTARDCASRRTT